MKKLLFALLFCVNSAAHASLWQVSMTAYAINSSNEIGLETAVYMFDPAALAYQRPDDALCAFDHRITTGPVISVRYSGLVNGGGPGGDLHAEQCGFNEFPFRIGGTRGFSVNPEFFIAPYALSSTEVRLLFSRIGSGGEDGWRWLHWSDPVPIDQLYGSFSVSPVSEPATLVLLLTAITILLFTRQRSE